MTKSLIGTWKMSHDGIGKGFDLLKQGSTLQDAIICAIQDVERREEFTSVGHGGLPNKDGFVQLDAAYMNGKTLSFGGVIEVDNIESPIAVAARLSDENCNCLLSGKGAKTFALNEGFHTQDHLTENAKKRWSIEHKKDQELCAYDGHDTVCVIGLNDDEMAVGTSTSGLFMKHAGRVGDSPIIGSGFYSDAKYGSAAATGLGEDIMRGCLSMRIVDKLAAGMDVREAAEQTLDDHMARMKEAGRDCGAISVIAMDKDGHYAAATNQRTFPFVVANENEFEYYFSSYTKGKHLMFIADPYLVKTYTGD